MGWLRGFGLVVVAVTTACGSSGHKPAPLQAEQTVQLTGDSPVALVVGAQPKHYDMTIDISADQPIDLSLITNRPVNEAIDLAKKHIAAKELYGKSNSQTHRIECTIGENIPVVLVVWQSNSSGRASLQIKRTK
jgi:hypothetical protein